MNALDWSRQFVERLTAVIDDCSQPRTERDRAAICLKFYFECEEKYRKESLDPVVIAMLTQNTQVDKLWDHPDKYSLVEETGEDGVIRRRVICTREEESPIYSPPPIKTEKINLLSDSMAQPETPVGPEWTGPPEPPRPSPIDDAVIQRGLARIQRQIDERKRQEQEDL